MKKYLLLLVFLAAGFSAQAQVLVRVNGENITFENDALVKITSNYNDIIFTRASGSTDVFDIRSIKGLYFAQESTEIASLPVGETAIVYDRQNDVVYVVNGENDKNLNVYTAEGLLVKRVQGNKVSLKGVAPGLFIVNYNNEINAKILRK